MNQAEIISMIIEARDNGCSTLSLLGNGLEVLPPEIGKLTRLIELDLGLNDLTELPPEIGNLKKLAKLNAGANDLTELPAEIGKLTDLTYLQLGHSQMLQQRNQLTRLPPEIGKMASLNGIDEATFSSLGPRVIEFPVALVGASVVTVLFVWLTARRLRRMDVP